LVRAHEVESIQRLGRNDERLIIGEIGEVSNELAGELAVAVQHEPDGANAVLPRAFAAAAAEQVVPRRTLDAQVMRRWDAWSRALVAHGSKIPRTLGGARAPCYRSRVGEPTGAAAASSFACVGLCCNSSIAFSS